MWDDNNLQLGSPARGICSEYAFFSVSKTIFSLCSTVSREGWWLQTQNKKKIRQGRNQTLQRVTFHGRHILWPKREYHSEYTWNVHIAKLSRVLIHTRISAKWLTPFNMKKMLCKHNSIARGGSLKWGLYHTELHGPNMCKPTEQIKKVASSHNIDLCYLTCCWESTKSSHSHSSFSPVSPIEGKKNMMPLLCSKHNNVIYLFILLAFSPALPCKQGSYVLIQLSQTK